MKVCEGLGTSDRTDRSYRSDRSDRIDRSDRSDRSDGSDILISLMYLRLNATE